MFQTCREAEMPPLARTVAIAAMAMGSASLGTQEYHYHGLYGSTRKIGALTPRLQVMSVYGHVACARLL